MRAQCSIQIEDGAWLACSTSAALTLEQQILRNALRQHPSQQLALLAKNLRASLQLMHFRL